MKRTLTVIFDGEVLRPTEPVELEPNHEYYVTVEDVNPADLGDDRPLAEFLEFAMDMNIPDLAEQHDHYLYGTPKR